MSSEYDFIIVGGGAAGGVLANRLSAHFKVVLIEAGPNANDDPRVKTPGLSVSLKESELDWAYHSEPEAGFNGRTVKHPAGKLLGGSSAINSHVLAHTTKSLHDEWVKLGNTDWSWEAMQPYYGFMSLENKSPLHSANYPGAGSGNVKASFCQTVHPLQEAFYEGCKNSSDGKSGASMVANAINLNGQRSHTGVTYILPALARLTVVRSQVTKVLFDGNQAIGVETSSGQIHGKEVILCAGTFGSAKILELSGIGRGTHIPSWLDLPVGENLQDHPNFSISVEGEGFEYPTERDSGEGWVYSYIYHSLKKDTLKGLEVDDPFLNKVVFDPEDSTAVLYLVKGSRHPELKGKFFAITVMYSYPLSRGTSKMMSEDVTATPRIEFRYFSEQTDIEVFARHVLEVEKILEGPMKKYIKPGGRRAPIYEPNLDSVKDALKAYAYTNYHPSGTCSMMAKAKGGVVGQDLKVYGTQGLRVCDASVIPVIPQANILSTVYAIAEKTASMILAEHSK